MKFIEWLLTKILPFRDIIKEVDGKPTLYLRRFFLWRNVKGSKTGDEGGVFLHFIHRNDDDRDPHDHPWDFTSFIVARGYKDEQWNCYEKEIESLPTFKQFNRDFMGYEDVKPFSTVFRKAEHVHRVRGIEPGKPAVTLVWTGPARREWGFMKYTGWTHWAVYLGIENWSGK